MERVVIVGAGTFGASLAWWLAGRGDEVVLVDQFEPGDVRAWALWRELEAEARVELLTECGVSWFAHSEDGWEAESGRVLDELGIPTERWSVEEAAARFPSFDGSDLAWVLHEPEAGVLRAQTAIHTLAARATAHGAELIRARATPVGDAVALDDGRTLEGDRIVWSSGCWLSMLFPELVTLRVTRQELFFFDGGTLWRDAPAWVDFDRAMYGTGDLDALGVKLAWDQEGPPLDPDAELPPATAETEQLTRGYAAGRFPALAQAPLTGSKCCRYEISADGHFIAAPHPEHEHVWIVGGGSGHGFKHGPAMAERIATAWDGGAPLPPHFALGERTVGVALRSAGSEF